GACRRKAAPGWLPPFVKYGSGRVIPSRHEIVQQVNFTDSPGCGSLPKRILEPPVLPVRSKEIWIGARRERREDIGSLVPGGHANLRRAHGIGKLDQQPRPKIIVERCLINQVDQSDELFVSA